MHGLGWMRDLPDHRDYIIDQHPDTAGWFNPTDRAGVPDLVRADPPPVVDLTQWCSPIEDQGRLGSCTAQAVIGICEFLQRRRGGMHIDASRLFNYKVARNMMGWVGDTGMYIRVSMQSLNVFGVPPERYWPHVVADFDQEPPAFVYSYAQRFRAINYYRLDRSGRSGEELAAMVKRVLVYRYPVVFGFMVYSYGNEDGEFPMPDPGQRPYGGHAVVAVGYDDTRVIGDSVGALKIRNSWGTDWGQDGYGWLPYDYVVRGLSADFWVLIYQERPRQLT